MARNIDVVEITGSNSVSVAEHEVATLLALVRNLIRECHYRFHWLSTLLRPISVPTMTWPNFCDPIAASHQIYASGGWNIADCVARSFDIEGMDVGTVGAGRIGLAVMRRLKAFGVKLHYHDTHRLAPTIEAELDATYHASPSALAHAVDAVLINCPLHPGTEHLFNAQLIAGMRRGSYIINNARGKVSNPCTVAVCSRVKQIVGTIALPFTSAHPFALADL